MTEGKEFLARKADFYNRYTFLICTSLFAILMIAVFCIVAYYNKHYKFGSLFNILMFPFFLIIISIIASKRTISYKLMLAEIAGYSREYINQTKTNLQLQADELSNRLGLKHTKINISFEQENYFKLPYIGLQNNIFVSNKALSELSKEEFEFLLIHYLYFPRFLYKYNVFNYFYIAPSLNMSKWFFRDLNFTNETANNLCILIQVIFFVPLFIIFIYTINSRHALTADKKALLITRNLEAAISALRKTLYPEKGELTPDMGVFKRIESLKKFAEENGIS